MATKTSSTQTRPEGILEMAERNGAMVLDTATVVAMQDEYARGDDMFWANAMTGMNTDQAGRLLWIMSHILPYDAFYRWSDIALGHNGIAWMQANGRLRDEINAAQTTIAKLAKDAEVVAALRHAALAERDAAKEAAEMLLRERNAARDDLFAANVMLRDMAKSMDDTNADWARQNDALRAEMDAACYGKSEYAAALDRNAATILRLESALRQALQEVVELKVAAALA